MINPWEEVKKIYNYVVIRIICKWQIKRIAMNKIGDTDDVAYAVLYLASDESKFMTGTELVLDGGLSAM